MDVVHPSPFGVVCLQWEMSGNSVVQNVLLLMTQVLRHQVNSVCVLSGHIHSYIEMTSSENSSQIFQPW